jgi:tellurite resistance protein TerC
LPIAGDANTSVFFFKNGGKWLITPLLLVLLTVETTDLVFALDSIPAIFGITIDPFVIFTSNIFAILGLRSLYFLLSGAVGKFHYLQASLGFILCFVGFKMLVSHYFEIPIVLSLEVIAGALATGIFASWLRENRNSSGSSTMKSEVPLDTKLD